jgi:hypothetical protein
MIKIIFEYYNNLRTYFNAGKYKKIKTKTLQNFARQKLAKRQKTIKNITVVD